MNSEEIYGVLTNEAKEKVGVWNEEVKEMFVKCVCEGMNVEYWSYKNGWRPIGLGNFYQRNIQRVALYLRQSTNNILRVRF